MDNRSLDEFADVGGEESREGETGVTDGDDDPDGDGDENGDGDGAGEADGGESAAGAEPTSAWSPAGGVCADCGETVERRWRGDGGLVCPDCKEW